MPRGAELFPGLAAFPVPCGRTDFHGDEPSFTVGSSQPFSVGFMMTIQATSHGSEWWKRSKQTNPDKGWGDSTLSRRISALDHKTLIETATVLHSAPNPHQLNIPNQKPKSLGLVN